MNSKSAHDREGSSSRTPPVSASNELHRCEQDDNAIPSAEFLRKLLQQRGTTKTAGDSKGENENIRVTKEEAINIERAFQEEDFRNLLSDYLKEISDPKHRAEQNEYIRYLEEQNAVPQGKKLIRPIPSFVLKLRYSETSNKSSISNVKPTFEQKLFVNVVTSTDIGLPTVVPKNDDSSTSCWSIPYTVGPMRNEYDKSKQNLIPTCDCCFHPNALLLSKSNAQFKKLLVGIAREGAAKQMKNQNRILIDCNFYRVLHGVSYMRDEPGVLVVSNNAAPLNINKCSSINKENDLTKKIQERDARATPQKVLDNNNTPQDKKEPTTVVPSTRPTQVVQKLEVALPSKQVEESTVPDFSISERGVFDIAGSSDARGTPVTSSPQFLIVRINLPNISCLTEIDVEVSEKRLVLTSERKLDSTTVKNQANPKRSAYALNCKLPYPTLADQGKADWDKSKRVLTVSLPVKQIPVKNRPTEIETISSDEAKQVKRAILSSSELQIVPSSKLNLGRKHKDHVHSRWIDAGKIECLNQSAPKNCNTMDVLTAPKGKAELSPKVQEKSCDETNALLSYSLGQKDNISINENFYEEIKTEDAKEKIERCAPEAMNFDASAKYNGSRPGYVFRSGAQGLGYYRDDYLSHALPAAEESRDKRCRNIQAAGMKFNTIKSDLAILID